MLELDPIVMARLVNVAEWYGISPARYCEVVLTRAVDSLVADNPNLDYLTELR
jgi:hypothetical protein